MKANTSKSLWGWFVYLILMECEHCILSRKVYHKYVIISTKMLFELVPEMTVDYNQ